MDAQALRYWVALNRVNGIGAARFHALLAHFQNDAEAAWRAPESVLADVLGERRTLAALLNARSTANIDDDLAAISRVGAWAITLADAEYPPLLRQIDRPPPLLYIKGELHETDVRALSLIGTRDATDYGLRVTRQMAHDLAVAGWTIVSGLAKGIDAAAHGRALRDGTRTLALLGHGIDRVYPVEHKGLAEMITGQHRGAILTEYPIGTPPDGKNFPQRNRLISGIARGVVVIEASLNSGALSTAKFALDHGREVLAVPGGIYEPQSHGTNKLIQDGQSKLVLKAADILTEFGETAPQSAKITVEMPKVDRPDRDRPKRTPVQPRAAQLAKAAAPAEPDLDPPLQAIWDAVQDEPMGLDDLCTVSGLSVAQISTALTMLEMRGLIRLSRGLVYGLSETD